ncbi:hypothetical protein M011DRAFT_45750 [Sporormia fimetaria CBS 119925]|uniref:Uncharacterized protein n=1 Tax=Sporormia fimetaria CBS 119925 TaxID=1340428 RepID=A0A6A6VBJ8_9PLEO|nr:hypothetical protein M011DRAFT_45750 [Sporormia fimetaria CBS 119925]
MSCCGYGVACGWHVVVVLLLNPPVPQVSLPNPTTCCPESVKAEKHNVGSRDTETQHDGATAVADHPVASHSGPRRSRARRSTTVTKPSPSTAGPQPFFSSFVNKLALWVRPRTRGQKMIYLAVFPIFCFFTILAVYLWWILDGPVRKWYIIVSFPVLLFSLVMTLSYSSVGRLLVGVVLGPAFVVR